MAGKTSMAGSGTQKKQVISASRRTDIPAFYMDWFMDSLGRGFFQVENPFSRKTSLVHVSPENTGTLVFWSKNFDVFLDNGYGEALRDMGYHLFFNFTVNSENRLLEPRVPALDRRLAQFGELCHRFGPETVTWRFDPICHYTLTGQGLHDNLDDFNRIAASAAQAGIRRCVTSFVDLYGKVLARTRAIPGFAFFDPTADEKRTVILKLANVLEPLGISLSLCCEADLIQTLPADCGIMANACIPNPLLEKLSGTCLSHARDSGQRKAKGCGCYVSKDIGSYRHQPCHHNCLFCYANPGSGKETERHG